MKLFGIQWFVYLLQEVGYSLYLVQIGRLRYPRWAVFLGSMFFQTLIMSLCLPNYNQLVWLRPLLYYSVHFLTLWLASEETLRRKWGYFAILLLASMLADLLSGVLGIYGMGRPASELLSAGESTGRIIGCSMYPINFTAISAVCLAFYQSMERSLRRKMIFLLVLLAASQNLLLIGIGRFNLEQAGDSIIWYVLICGAVSILSQYYVYQTIQSSVRAVQSQMELEQLKLQRDLDYRYYRLAQESAAELSTFRHDFKNQLQVAYALAKREPEQAASLLGELEERLNAIRPLRYCANPIVNTVLTVKAAQAEEQGIGFTAQAAVEDWSMEEIDLSSLFSNLLDNAIEGCRRSGAKQPTLEVKAGTRQGYYIVRVTNTCGPDIQLNGTSKEDKQGHGLGLSILQEIARKYGGEFRTRTENGVFLAEIVMEAA
ncbi:MAG: sensor histidine kinase [Candidatus Onthomonas sp.]